MSIIIPANSAVGGGFDAANGIRLDNNAYLNRTFSEAGASGGGGTFKWTLSFWLKRSILSTQQTIMSRYVNANKYVKILINNANQLEYAVYNSAYQARYETSALFRDTSAWSHIVIAQDSTQGTAADRVKFFINGNLVTSFATNTQIGQNVGGDFNTNNAPHQIGAFNAGDEFQGYFSQFCFVDNVQYNADQFGEFDSDSGVWKPIDVSGLSTGATSFFLAFEDSSDLGTDSSGDNNDFSLNNITAVDQTVDSCTNNFAVLNILDNFYPNATFSQGNTEIVSPSGREASSSSTIYLTQGKWYWETKFFSASAPFVGIQPVVSSSNTTTPAVLQSNGLGILKTGKVETTNGSGGSTVLASYATFTTNDIIGTALDLDANKIYFYKNGSILGANGVSITAPASTINGHYMVAVGNISGTDTISVNFGSPSFAISSSNQDGNDRGNFEYAVPSGYLSICTKNLSEALS